MHYPPLMKTILIGLLVILIVLASVGFLLPTRYRIEERVTIQANPMRIHEHVSDLEKWENWAPWIKGDRSILITYGDQTIGVGARQSWTSESGEGELTFTKCDLKTGITYDLVSSMSGKGAPAACAILYEPNGAATDVVWTMEGDVADSRPRIIAGYVNFFTQGSIASTVARGLKTLKKKVEG